MLLSWYLLLAVFKHIQIIRNFLFSLLEHLKWNKLTIIYCAKKTAVKIMLIFYLYYIRKSRYFYKLD